MPDLEVRGRAAEPSDYPHFVRMFAELGVDDPVPDEARWSAELAKDAIFLVDAKGSVVAYALVRALDGIGHVTHAVVDPAARGRGVGRALMMRAAERLRAAGCSEWYLNVKPENLPAIRLYERVGFARMYSAVAMQLAWRDVARLPGEGEALARAIDPSGAEDSAIERAFDLPKGQVANLRGRGYVLVARRDEAGPTAFAAFDPSFPGANPFRVKKALLARALLEAMRPHARPEHPTLRLVAENDPVLAATMHAAGAVTVLRVDHMRGKIPALPA